MKYKLFFLPIVLLLAIEITQAEQASTRPQAAQVKPNIVLLYIDDWAWYGSPVPMDDTRDNSSMPAVQMPNVQRLAQEGMKFSRAFGSPQCSPARVCIQTGQSSPRNGFTVFMNSGDQDYYNARKYKDYPVIGCIADSTIDPETTTIPEALKPLGYVSAHIGKWHMGGDPGDEGYAVHDGNTNNNPGNTLEGADKLRIPDTIKDPKLMYSITEKSIQFMEAQAKAGKPFYLQISHYAMHEGPECHPRTRAKYINHPLVQADYKKKKTAADKVKRKSDAANWLGMAEEMDGRIGAVMDKLVELGIYENTYVVMVADNGYRHKFFGDKKQPLHAHKWWAWDGGIRVPMIVKGPGIKSGSAFHGNVVNYDFLPTFVDWAGGNPNSLKEIDGVSLAPYMAGKAPEDSFLNRPLYFHYPHNRTSMPHSAVIAGRHKLMHFYESEDIPMLFDTHKDPGEVNNIADSNPETHRKLFKQMMGYLKDVGARMPKRNPNYDPEAFKKTEAYRKISKWSAFKGKRALEADES